VLRFRATATDAFGNAVPASFAWRVAPVALGTVEATGADGATFTAGRLVREGRVVVVAGAAGSAAASVTVLPGTLRIASIDTRRTATGARLAVRVVDGAGRPVPAALLRVLVRSGGKLVSSSRVGTGPAGRALLRIPVRRGTCATTTVGHASAAGFRWDGRTPRSRVCR
jgi:hypothetical protein